MAGREAFIPLLLVAALSIVDGFVNSPKIINKDGNLIFESGSNRNISFLLSGKSRLTINGNYDVLELLLAISGSNGSSYAKKRQGIGKDEWSTQEDAADIRDLAEDLLSLKTRTYGTNGLSAQLRQQMNRTRVARVLLRRYQQRLRTVEIKVQRLSSQLELNSCQSNPCGNGGSCYNTFNGFRCQCRSGFEGTKCENDVNECTLYRGTDLGCQNGAQCVNQLGSFSCICTPGWYGVHCTQRKGDCSQSSTWELCGHGSCVASSDSFGYKCLCEPGWKTNGLTPACTVDVDECSAETHTPCITKCINLPGSFTCAPCAAGLTGNGVSCRDINECETNNGGCSLSPHVDCINSYGSFHCGECPVGWQGDGRSCTRSSTSEYGDGNGGIITGNGFTNCAQHAFICHPSAKCSEISGTVVCSCPTGTVGSGIGPRGCLPGTANNCNALPCLNGGTCVDVGPSNYTCICPYGYRLPRCEPVPDACQPNPCHNGGRCRSHDGDFLCQCQPGTRGRKCETRFNSCNALLTGISGSLKYPPEGTGYDHNAQCAWVIRTNESLVLNVTFNKFDVEDATECRFDWLQINDGRTSAAQLVGRYCGNHRPHGGNIISSTNYLYLWFRSDNSTSREGFDLQWESIAPQCGGPVDFDTYGTIATPGSPGQYPRNRDCQWHLHAPSNKRIKLTFFRLELEQHANCNFDYVAITDAISGMELYKYCTSGHPAPLLLPTHEAIVHFHSDAEGSDGGFQLHYSTEERLPGCGGIYTTLQGSIKSPIYDADEMMSCDYEIRMAPGESVFIHFVSVDLPDATDCIELYDIGDDNSSVSILQAKYCGGYALESELPPAFNSLYNRVRIMFYSRRGRFELSYRMDCSYVYESNTGVISSPGYPNLTNNDRFCTYKIITEPRTVIELTRIDFQLNDNSQLDSDEENDDCANTFLRINDNLDKNMLGPYCGQTMPEQDLVSKTNMLIFHLKTSSTSTGRGYKFRYRAVPMGAMDCGGVYTKSNQTIRLPVGPDGKYTDSMTCFWVIMAPPRKGIMLQWLSFSLEASSDCTFDYVEVYDNLANNDSDEPLGRYCDLMPPPDFVSNSRLLTIKFVSDHSDNADGFELGFQFVDNDSCGGHIHASVGRLTSPEFPKNYTNGVDCEWRITGPQGSQIELQLEFFELEATSNCSGDWLMVRNGDSNSSMIIGRFCGTSIPSRIPSFTNELFVQFHSDSFVNARGFRLGWRVFANGCGGRLQSEEGVITSPRYPNEYPNNVHCEWQVSVHPGGAIRFTIEDLSLETLSECHYDYLEIFDGYKKASNSLLFRPCQASDDIKELELTSNEATIIFHSDNSNSDRGFRMSYRSDCWRNITDAQGVIESINFNERLFERNVNCSWSIKAPSGNHIELEFSHLENNLRDSSGLYLQESANSTAQSVTSLGAYNITGDTLTIIHNSSDISFRLEYRIVGCLHQLKGERGDFQSPNYPGMYPNNMECYWIIHADQGKRIELTVFELDVEMSTNCSKDALIIANHATEYNVRERHCGSIPKQLITSAGHRLYVRFISDSSHNGRGFNASYRIIESKCGGKMITKQGIIQSPQYPMPYPINSNCEWTIEVSPHHTINFELEDISLETGHSCGWDYLEAFDLSADGIDDSDGNRIFRICDVPENENMHSSSNLALVRFISDDSMQHRGFKLHYYESCGETRLIDETEFEYIDIARHVPSNETCVWKLIAADPTKRIIFTPTHVLLNPVAAAKYPTEGDCMPNGVQVYEGTEATGRARLQYCNSHPPAIISSGNALTISVPFNLVSEFESHYMTMDTLCGSLYYSLYGKFTSPYYPESYPVNIECQWGIEASAGNSITVTFESLDMEQSDGCNNDYLEVREDDERGTLLGVYCGNNIPTPVKSKSAVWIKFKSNDDIVGEGFIASYNYERHNELSGTNGTVESPRYPSKFHSQDIYSWRITVEKDYVVLIRMKHMIDINLPHVRFYDGYSDIGAQLDLSESDVVRSNTNILYVTATSGPFQFQWERLSKEALRSNRTAEERARQCGKQLLTINNTISFNSPGYPHGYADNLQCEWTFVPGDPAMHVVLDLVKVDLESLHGCFGDYVRVLSSNDLVTWKPLIKTCNQPNASEASTWHGKPYLRLDFVTDLGINETGFSTRVRTICGSELNAPNGIINITRIMLPGTHECEWKIHVRRGRRVRITFLESQLRSDTSVVTSESESCRTYFLVRNGLAEDSPFLGRGKYCQNNITDILETSSNRAYVKFKGFLRFRAAFRYEEISHACSDEIVLTEEYVFNGNGREITSPNFPNLPNPHSECVWKISAPQHHTIAVEFLGTFDLTPGSGSTGDSCDREYIQVNDGSTEMMPMLGRYCGKQKPNSIFSTGSAMRLKYFTDVSEPHQGFRARLSLGRCGGTYYSNEGVINSPEHLQIDRDYRNFECVYTIEVEKGSTINLKFDSMHLPISENCSEHTHLQLDEIEAFGFDGEEKVSDQLLLCGNGARHYTVETNKLIMRLRLLDGPLGADEGFKVSYKAIGSRCSETIVAMTGVLQSPGYPDGVTTPTHCSWRLQVAKGRRIRVQVLDFDMGAKNTSQVSSFRGRLSFANDFKMQSIIGRYSESPPGDIYSTDNTMGIDVFLLPINRHRGFKLRFTAYGESECRLGPIEEGTMSFRRANGTLSAGNNLVHCSYELKVPVNSTLLISVRSHVSRAPLMLNPYVCAIVSPMRIYLNSVQLLPRLLCNNSSSIMDSKPIVRLPFSTQLEISGNSRNGLQELVVDYKMHNCGGIWRLDFGNNVTIQQPLMDNEYRNSSLDCAWAVWPPSFSEEDLNELEYWADDVQIEISLSVDFAGDCKEHYLVLYNGPDQNSPHLGRFCNQATLLNFVVERGLFFEYHTEHYESNSTFNVTLKHGSGCGGKIVYPYRNIAFYEQYKNNVECVWEIETEPGFHVGLSFLNRFYIESSTNCSKDYIKVQERGDTPGEWIDLQTICGREPPNAINTSTSAMRVIFRSDGDIVGDGFMAHFDRNCGGLLYATSTNQVLTSPGYPQQYMKNLYCNYTIIPLESSAPGVLVRFLDFDLEQPPISNCMFDNVTVQVGKDRRTEAVLCGVKYKHEYRGQAISLIFRTDMSFSGKGFKLDYSTNLCGGNITQTSMVESPRQHTDNSFPPNSHCYWNLKAPVGHKFTIKFEYLDFESQMRCSNDGVEVFKGPVADPKSRLGQFCGDLTGQLPTLNVDSNQALIHSYSDDRDASRGFRALVRVIPNCDEKILLSAQNSSYTFNKYADGYTDDLDCTYIFTAEPGWQLQLEFRSFHVEATEECRNDFLEIRDGAGPFADSMGVFCGQVLPPKLTSSRHALFLRFVSDTTVNDRGFQVVVTAIRSVCGQQEFKLEGNAHVELNSSLDEQGHYPNNMFCYWRIVGEQAVHLKFNNFDLQEPNSNGTCDTDYLKIYNREDSHLIELGTGSELTFNGHTAGQTYNSYALEHIYCGNGLPDDYYSNSKEVIVKFHSDATITKQGFSLTAMEAQGCFRNFSGVQGRIYVKDTADHCDIFINAPDNHSLSLYYNDLMYGTYDCEMEFVEVFDAHTNTSLQKVCFFQDAAKSLFSTTNQLRMRIKMSGHFSTYDITYLASRDGPGCGGDLYNTEGIFSNAFYPRNVRNNSDCRWRVRVPSNTHVLLVFEFFDLGSKSTCHTDYVRILERTKGDLEQEVRRFCGEDKPKVYKSSRSEVIVHFHKTVNYDGIGWVIKFVSVYSNYDIPSYMLH
ncbi:cubilin homolog [Scaptodrosophila lebanonensis]|uniref:Cubilin homolog n=1 Tax=Drosophila lebanonensis TaxID=7225 RepID=A0A6J2TZD9_DROLE|nr:cubilin homolog [Scaptodrosophila lebanonensis]